MVKATERDASTPALWGALKPGDNGVGFRQVFAFDKSRTWLPRRDVDGKFTPDANGRPIQINVWYPAVEESKRQMTLGDYIEHTVPTGFDRSTAEMLRRMSPLGRNRSRLPASACPP